MGAHDAALVEEGDERVAVHGPADGLQTCYSRLENVAEAEGRKLVAEVVAGATFRDGTEIIEGPSSRAA